MKLSMQAKVGIVAVAAALILATMIMWKGDVFLKARGYSLIGSFENAGGLMPGAEVRYRGYKIGKVVKIEPNPQDVRVHLLIQQNINVPEGSSLRVAFDGLIGQKYVEIIPGLSAVNIKSGGVVPGFSTLGIVDFIDIGTQNLEESKKILQSVRKITDDPLIQKAAKDTLLNIERSTYEINRVAAGLSKALAKGGFDEMIKSLSLASDTINRVSKRLDSIITAMDKLVSDPDFTSDIKATVRNAKDAFDEFKKASTDASKVLKRYAK